MMTRGQTMTGSFDQMIEALGGSEPMPETPAAMLDLMQSMNENLAVCEAAGPGFYLVTPKAFAVLADFTAEKAERLAAALASRMPRAIVVHIQADDAMSAHARKRIMETIAGNRALETGIDVDGLVNGLPGLMQEMGTDDWQEATEAICQRIRSIVLVPFH